MSTGRPHVCPSCSRSYSSGELHCPVDGARLDASEPHQDPLIGQLISGRYEVLSRLGSGGMGVVYRALQSQLDRPVALKLLTARLGADAQVEERFRTEARAASQLTNPHTVTVYDFGATSDGSLFIAMQLVEGESLRTRLARGPLSVRHALTITAQVCDSLAEAHNHRPQIIHRDIKPDNIMLRGTPGGEPFAVVLDFGLARFTDSQHLTASNSVIGTPAYMSPEQGRGGVDIDVRSDIYAAGIVLFEMLTGQVPLDSPDGVQTLYKHAFEAPPLLIEKNPSLDAPESVQQLVSEMLAKLPDERPGSAVEVQERVLQILQELPFDESAVSTEMEVARIRPTLSPRPRPRMSPSPRTVSSRPVMVPMEEPVSAPPVFELTPQSQDLERKAARLRGRLRLRLALLTAVAVIVVGGTLGLVVANQRAEAAGAHEPAPLANSEEKETPTLAVKAPAVPVLTAAPETGAVPSRGGQVPAGAVVPTGALAAAGVPGTTGAAGASGVEATVPAAVAAAPTGALAATGFAKPLVVGSGGAHDPAATVDVVKPSDLPKAPSATAQDKHPEKEKEKEDPPPLSQEDLDKLKL